MALEAELGARRLAKPGQPDVVVGAACVDRGRCPRARRSPAICAGRADIERAAQAVQHVGDGGRAIGPADAQRRRGRRSSRRCASSPSLSACVDQLDARLVVVAARHIRHRPRRSPAGRSSGRPARSRSQLVGRISSCRSGCSDWRGTRAASAASRARASASTSAVRSFSGAATGVAPTASARDRVHEEAVPAVAASRRPARHRRARRRVSSSSEPAPQTMRFGSRPCTAPIASRSASRRRRDSDAARRRPRDRPRTARGLGPSALSFEASFGYSAHAAGESGLPRHIGRDVEDAGTRSQLAHGWPFTKNEGRSRP